LTTDFETIPATTSGQSSTTQGFGKPSPSKLQHAIVDRIMSLPEQNKSELIRIVEEEYRNPANQAISEHVPISTVPREDTLKSQAMPSETQQQASWEAPEEGGLANSKDKGHQIYTSISQPSGFSSAACEDHPNQDPPVIASELSIPDDSVEGCHCVGTCQCPSGRCSSSMMQDCQFEQCYKDFIMDEADDECWPSDTSNYTY